MPDKRITIEELEDNFNRMGLVKVRKLEEIVLTRSFIADTSYSMHSEAGDPAKDKDFVVYPAIKKMNLAHDLLNLYGTHWKYEASAADWSDVRKVDGDSDIVIEALRSGKKEFRHAVYAFTQQYVDNFGSLWRFIPDTVGDFFLQEIIMPRYRRDFAEYRKLKSEARIRP